MRRRLAVVAARAVRAIRGLCPDRESRDGLASAGAIVATWPARPAHHPLVVTLPAIALTPMAQHRPERGDNRAS
jgi:hypothetical protein